MLKILLLTLILVGSITVTQAQEKNEARKFFEFGKISKSLLKEKMEAFYAELRKNPQSQGYIINYGTNIEIDKRENEIRDLPIKREYDGLRITFVRGDKKELLTVLWLVQYGAKPPTP